MKACDQRSMLCGLFLFLVTCGALVGGPQAFASEFEAFDYEEVAASESTNKAGAHPDLTMKFVFSHKEEGGVQVSTAYPENLTQEIPPGLVGNPNAVVPCSTGQFQAFGNCPVDAQVGITKVFISGRTEVLTEPLYRLEPPRESEVARLGFIAALFPVYVDVSVRAASDYGVTATVQGATPLEPIISAETILWGVPALPIHDEQRLTPLEALFCGTGTPCFAGGSRPSGLARRPFMTNPTACEGQEIAYSATAYQLPGRSIHASAALPPTVECESVAFAPTLKVEPTSHEAGAPTGLRAVLRIPQTDAANLPASSAMRAAKVTLPEGMTLAAGAADGLAGCSSEQVGLGHEQPSNCPSASSLGTATFVSPLLPRPLHGTIYQRSPEPGHLFRLWLVTDELGLHLKLQGDIHTDAASGQLTATFAGLPQLPVEEVALELNGGPRAPLENPGACGAYKSLYELSPWSGNAPSVGETGMTISEGCRSSSFSPKLEAGVADPIAGVFTPLLVTLTRSDRDENLASFDLTLPPGVLAKPKGVPLCPDSAASDGNCPSDSQIGSLSVAAGAGPQPLWIPQPGKQLTALYLAGPYKGTPYSVIAKVPAEAGPFDLGTVIVRNGIYVDPDTAQLTLRSDPLPQILEGVPVRYRTIHASVDRDNFALSPTNCAVLQAEATVRSPRGDIARPKDRFQVGECSKLKFAPQLTVALKGGTKRASFPALKATVVTHKEEANFRKVSVALPHSEFLAQEHIKTVCTRVQFAAESCPAGSVYGRARVITPLLDQPLEGPVYLRSSSNPLPDLVVALRGQIDLNLDGRIDSVHGGLRATFPGLPDAPVTRFVMQLYGGRKGLIVNSTDTCRDHHRATVKMAGQNGRLHQIAARIRRGCHRSRG